MTADTSTARHTLAPLALGSVTRIDLITDEMIEDDESGFIEAGDCEINLEGPGAAEYARRIVLCVNTHDELLAALKRIAGMPEVRRAIEGCSAMDEVDAAIAKAEGLSHLDPEGALK